MIVLKFGGSSIGSIERITSALDIIQEQSHEGKPFCVVVSAMGDTTDRLIEASEQASSGNDNYVKTISDIFHIFQKTLKVLVPGKMSENISLDINGMRGKLLDILQGVKLVSEVTGKTKASVMSFGERLSAQIITQALRSRQVETDYVDMRTVIKTDSDYLNGHVDTKNTYEEIRKRIPACNGVPILTGFIASNEKNETTTLGRGGSDYTAALVAAALAAERVEIWTDVNGVMTADPRSVPKALPIPMMTYEELMELSHFGAQVIYPPTVAPLLDAGIPIFIRNTLNPSHAGSKIAVDAPRGENSPVTGIASIPQVALLQLEGAGMMGVPGIASRLFYCLAQNKISVIMISQGSSEHSICFAISPESLFSAKKAVAREFAVELKAREIDPLQITEGMSIIALVGRNMHHQPGIAGRFFQALGKNGINIAAIAQGSSEFNISIVINFADEAKALNALHDAFFLSDLKTVNVFLVGVGLIGKTLLSQITDQLRAIQKEQGVDLRIVALADSKKMTFDAQGIHANNWKSVLNSSKQKMDPNLFVEKMVSLNLPNSIFVDCTASPHIANCYERVLSQSISVVTANKLANASEYKVYKALKREATKSNVRFFYETNVGAGLPIIGTIRDLISSGDEIQKIEAVLSGTLSFLFTSFTPDRTFSDVLSEARNKGFTEPNPAEDLSGRDVGRKLLILAREIGLPLEEADVEVESLVPENCEGIDSAEEFLEKLTGSDEDFKKRLNQATSNGERLQYIGSVENGEARVSLQEIASSHPFYNLQGSDNIVALKTKRYQETPLVVRGPGAGGEVTAAGVMADILRAASYLL